MKGKHISSRAIIKLLQRSGKATIKQDVRTIWRANHVHLPQSQRVVN